MIFDNWFGFSNDLQERIKIAFDLESISIPFPQREVYVHKR